MGGIIAYGWVQSLKNKTVSDFFLGNKNLPWVVAMLSIVATETSVLTFISIPGIAYRGNWFFLQLAIGYILGRVLVSVFFLPKYFTSGITSIYEILGEKYGKPIQKVASGIFLVTRVLADGIRFLATAVIVQVVTGWSLPFSVLIIGLVTVIYSSLGGIKTIVWIDSMQFLLYLAGGLITVLFILFNSEEPFGSIVNQLSETGKLSIFNLSGNILEDPYFFISAIIGGIFLSFSSHGVDYMMVQRVLTTKDLRSGQKAMIGSGVFVLLQFAIFLFAGSLIHHFFGGVELEKDREFSTFIVQYLPVGLRGLLLAGILSAAMSTLSSSINSLASSTIIDWFGGNSNLRFSKLVSLFWAFVLISIALVFDESDSAIVIIGLQIASFTYGGLLGLFLLTKFKKKFHIISLISGLLSSLLIVFYLKHIGLAWTWFIMVSAFINVVVCNIVDFFVQHKNGKMFLLPVTLFSLWVFYMLVSIEQNKILEQDSKLLKTILNQVDKKYADIINDPDKYKFQVMYTKINRDKNNQPEFISHSFGVAPDKYFYPASTVKLQVAALSLERLNQTTSIDKDTFLKIKSGFGSLEGATVDSTAKYGLPTIGHYLHKLFVVSDNDAFNRLYEYLGSDHINSRMWELGFPKTRIRHRLSLSLTERENQYANAIQFYKDSGIIFEQPSREMRLDLDSPFEDFLLGDSHNVMGEKVEEPMDFSKKNFMSIPDQHKFLIQLIFPTENNSENQLSLSDSDRKFILNKMSILPRHSTHPKYNSKFTDGYCKFFMFGDSKATIPDHIKIFNKVGLAYGFVLDNAYIIDQKHGVEFFLTAVVYGNRNGVLNDNIYDYDNLTIPFLAAVGNVIYKYEIEREKKYAPDLSYFQQL